MRPVKEFSPARKVVRILLTTMPFIISRCSLLFSVNEEHLSAYCYNNELG
jgi:hypothetical protein